VDDALPVIACSLNGNEQRERLAEWKSLLAHAASRDEVPGGFRFVFRPAADFAERVRRLSAAEHDCCPFLRFEVAQIGDAVVLTVETEPAGQEALRFVFS
jgi:hypothetical protein